MPGGTLTQNRSSRAGDTQTPRLPSTMQQQETASLSDQAIDDLYVAQYLAMTGMSDTAGRDVTRINVACPAIPPDNMFVSVVSAPALPAVQRLS